LKESFTHKANLKMVLLALFGATMGQGVIWYTGQFYAQSFLENVCKIEFEQSRTILIWAILFATPFFVLFGWLSDKIGRKWIMMAGMLLGILLYRPIFNEFVKDTDAERWMKQDLIVLQSDTFHIKTFYEPITNTSEQKNVIQIKHSVDSIVTKYKNYYGSRFTASRKDTTIYHLFNAFYKKDPIPLAYNKVLGFEIYVKFMLLVWLLILFVTMVYGPIAAFLVELFPTKIRYTSMSLPYHIGNGVFGGLTPFIATLLTTIYTADKLVGLWYPIIVAAVCLVIGMLYVSNRIDPDVND
jgi:MFS family permease